jgi:predicted metallopeptidase
MELNPAKDIEKRVRQILPQLPFGHINPDRIVCMRSSGSKSRARARIWSFPRIWQLALNIPPAYVIEVLSEKFDHLADDDKNRIIIHELMHIPKNFSGALVPHRGRYHAINSRSVEKLFRIFKESL